MSETHFRVTGMSCHSCEDAVRREVITLDGVRAATVNAAAGTLVISTERPVSATEVIAAVDRAGYDASLAS